MIFMLPLYIVGWLLRLLFSRHWYIAVVILGTFVLFVMTYPR